MGQTALKVAVTHTDERCENGQDLRYSTIIRLAIYFNLKIKEFFAEGFR
jgi:hypothetical protein